MIGNLYTFAPLDFMDEWSVEGRQRKRPFSLNLKCAAAAGSNFDLFFLLSLLIRTKKS